MKTKTLTIDQWCEYAHIGACIPITVTLNGSSMEPLIRYKKDPVTIIPIYRDPMIGDIVLFRRADGAFVAHRVFQVSSQSVITWGDNCIFPDKPIDKDDVLGLLVSTKRFGRRILLDTEKQRSFGVFWMRTGRKPWHLYRRMRARVGKFVRTIYNKYFYIRVYFF